MRLHTFAFVVLVLVLSLLAVNAHADGVVLGTGANYAVLGASSVTNTGATTINDGNVGVYPGTSITDAGTITITAGNTIGLATSTNQTDLITAINDLSGLSSLNIGTAGLTGVVTVTPGVYSSPSSFLLNGTLTLNAEGLSNVDFIFLLGSDSLLTAAVGSNVVLENNTGSNVGVYWVAPMGSATLDGSTFVGNVLAGTSITMGGGVTITCGSVLANTGDVTMINDTIDTGCNGSPYINSSGTVVTTNGGSTGPGPGTTPVPTPEPGTFALLLCGLLPIGLMAFRKSRISSLSC